MSVNNRWYTIIVDVYRCTGHALNAYNAFVFGLVSQHWTGNTVTNSKDTVKVIKKIIIIRSRQLQIPKGLPGHVCLEPLINFNSISVIFLNAHFF